MLIKCPECELQVSDKALSCPHCGYPLKSDNKKSARKKPNKRRRLPNGFGQISELKGQNLRKPFRAMITIGKTDEGKPICKLLQPEAYFATYNEAYEALLNYNKNPYDISKNITVEELYEKWSSSYYRDNSYGTTKNLKGAWNYCQSLRKIKVHDIRAYHIKQCMEEAVVIANGVEKHTTPTIRRNMKSLLRKMFDYAVEYDIIQHNYAKDASLPKSDSRILEEERNEHIEYTDKELEILWQNINTYPLAEVVIVQCYTGWRPTELGNIKLADVDLQEGIMRGGMKTKSGRNRVVPIHSRIFPIIERWYNQGVADGREYLISIPSKTGRKADRLTYIRFVENLPRLSEKLHLNPDHKPHDGRVTFVTQAKKYQMDEYAIKRIVGHRINDVTEAIYTRRGNEWLKDEIEKIK